MHLWIAAFLALAKVAFPDTAAGHHAEAYLAAYNAGDDAALSRFLETHASQASLKQRPIADRLGILHGLRQQHGRLTLVRVTDAAPDHVDVTVEAEHGGRLSMSFLCDPDPPYAFVAVRVEDLGDVPGSQPPSGASAVTRTKTDAEIGAALDELLSPLAQKGEFSGAVLLAKGEAPLFRKAYGLASHASSTANRPDTKFNLGSMNKTFTRIVIESLAAEGKLALSDTLDKYVPEYPLDKGRSITIAQLLEHRGGTGDFFGPAYDAFDKKRLTTLRDWLPLFKDEPLHFAPGTREEYSNAGYLLLGLVIEKITGRSYFDVVRERIFAPARMTDTDSYPVAASVENRAVGYSRSSGPGDAWAENSGTLPARGSSAGGGYSTLDDLLKFAVAWRGGRFGTPAPGALMIAGGAPGVNALMGMMDDYTFVVLANLDPPAAEEIGMKLEAWLGGGGGSRKHVVKRIHTGAEADPDPRPRKSSLPEGGVDVPMLRSGHLPAVRAMVNGQGPFLFAIDTGAGSGLMLDPALVERLGLSTVGEMAMDDPSGENRQSVPVVSVDRVEIAGASFEGLAAGVQSFRGVLPGEPVDGLIGLPLFADALATLDFPAARVRVQKGELPPANDNDVLAYQDEAGVPAIVVGIAGRELLAHVDVGSMGGLNLPESLAASLPLASAPHVVGHARTMNNSFEVTAAPLQGDVAIGGYTVHEPMIEFQPVFPLANLGSRVLGDFALTFDQKNRRLRLSKPAPVGGEA